jgi:hypothetical protein
MKGTMRNVESARQQAEAICEKIAAYNAAMPESDDGFLVVMALSWARGREASAAPLGCEQVIKSTEEEGLAG